jgi:hypothetical protein
MVMQISPSNPNPDNSRPGDSKEVIGAVLEWTKQITTLGTGTLVLSATFITDILKGKIEYDWILIVSWVLFAISAVLGIFVMGNMCFLFSSRNKETPSIYNLTTRILAIIHFVTFAVGLIGFVFFASFNFSHRDNKIMLSPSNVENPTVIHPSQLNEDNSQNQKTQ